jgi:hypothetical protein
MWDLFAILSLTGYEDFTASRISVNKVTAAEGFGGAASSFFFIELIALTTI